LLVKVSDTEGLTSAILTLIKDEPLRQKMAEEGRRLVHEEFSVDNMVEGNLRVYREMLIV
ncbi:MAG: glycosyltransferase family 1 protein, partial [Nitrospirae bacterium]